jgi:voltage-dependent potassium channel beta subunit
MVELESMEYRHLGRSGLKVSALSIGNWLTCDNPEVEEVQFNCFSRAINNGINFLDTAEVYGMGSAETILGNILKRGDWDRDRLVISTKFMRSGVGPNRAGLSRKRLVQAMRNSLKRLQLDYADIFFLHRPDPETPLEESVRAITHLIESGKADYWGVSEFTVQEIMMIYDICDKYGLPYPSAEQCQYHMLHREKFEVDMVPLYDKYGLGTTVWSPLAGGVLSGKYNNGIPPSESRFGNSDNEMLKSIFNRYFNENTKEHTLTALRGLAEISRDLGCSQAQLALGWVLKSNDVSTAIFGATRVEQVDDNIGALQVVKSLTPEILQRIEDLLGNKPETRYNWRTFEKEPSRR